MLKKLKMKLKRFIDKMNGINRIDTIYKFNENFCSLHDDTVLFKIGSDLVPLVEEVIKTIGSSRTTLRNETGFVFPLVRIIDSKAIQENEMVIYIQGREIFHEFLVFNKKEVNKEIDVIIRKIYDEFLDEIFTNEILEGYINQVQRKNAWLINDVMQILFVSEIKQLLMSLLKNGKSIKNISLIFEKISTIINCNYRWQPRINIIFLEKALNNLV